MSSDIECSDGLLGGVNTSLGVECSLGIWGSLGGIDIVFGVEF